MQGPERLVNLVNPVNLVNLDCLIRQAIRYLSLHEPSLLGGPETLPPAIPPLLPEAVTGRQLQEA